MYNSWKDFTRIYRLGGHRKFGVQFGFGILGARQNDVVYQTLTTETDKGFHSA